jgi:hypothetical protein
MTAAAKCRLDWCEFDDNDDQQHFTMIYTSASHPAHPMLTVGAGVNWLEAEDGRRPAVVVHIVSREDGTSGRYVDEDVHLRLDEAMELRGMLDRAISIAETVERVDAK